ncbi:MAG: hypothetical protein L0H96_03205 [Humibacillus sp.]|nr:hypothetical protein [Humibacillus sp.]MDN5775900.1 hypothetical protein [Humibacillus sp.]
MSIVITRAVAPPRLSRRERHAERRRLQRLDTLSARLAELSAIADLLERAVQVVAGGWVQGAWFSVEAPAGQRAVTAHDLRLAIDHPVTGACLVGGVVQGAGGPAAATSQLVQRTLDLLWHTLRENPTQPVRWCPGPQARQVMLRQLTRWNDDPRRRRQEVLDLLVAAQHTAAVQREMCLAQRGALAGSDACSSPDGTRLR